MATIGYKSGPTLPPICRLFCWKAPTIGINGRYYL